MKFKKLEIVRLSDDGQVLKRVQCFAGRVTVFRAQSDSEPEAFSAALARKAQPQRFSVLLDEQDFNPREHRLIGFGENFRQERRTVRQFLLESGVNESAVDSLLLKVGLGGMGQSLCARLKPAEERTLRLLAAFNDESKVIILRDPFVEIKEEWMELLAQFLVHTAWEKQLIVVVTKLSERPQCWIDNELISRIQLDARKRQRTIGFGGGGDEGNNVVSRLRDVLKSGTELPTQSKNNLLVAPALKQIKRNHKRYVVALILGVFIGTLALFFLKKSGSLSPSDSSVDLAALAPEAPLPAPVSAKLEPPDQPGIAQGDKNASNLPQDANAPGQPALNASTAEGVSVPASTVPATAQPVELRPVRVAADSVLALYPEEIQDVVLKTLDGTSFISSTLKSANRFPRMKPVARIKKEKTPPAAAESKENAVVSEEETMPPPELSGELPSAPFQAIDNYYPGPEQEHLRELLRQRLRTLMQEDLQAPGANS